MCGCENDGNGVHTIRILYRMNELKAIHLG